MSMQHVRRSLVIAALLAVGGGVFAGSVSAQVPSVINYQGAVTTNDGPVPDQVRLTFAFYTTPDPSTDEAPLAGWTETHTEVPVQEGRFSVLVGSINALPADLFTREDVYLEVRIADEALTRTRIVSTPFALRAAEADAARSMAPQGVDTEALADGAVTQAKIADQVSFEPAPGSITTAEIQDGTIQAGDLQGGAVVREAIAGGAVGTGQLADDAVTQAKIAGDAVASSQIADGGVAGSDIASNTVVRSIAGPDGTVLADDLTLQEGQDINLDLDQESGTLTISADGGFFSRTEPSSRRWKTDIRDIEAARALVDQLRGVRYRWTESGEADVGVIAEEVAKVLPELVKFDDDGRPSGVRYAGLTALLLEAVKAQQAELNARRRTVERQQSEMDAMKEHVEALAERVKQLEHAVRSATSPNDSE